MGNTILGIDLAKRTFQLHLADESGRALLRKKVARKELLETVLKLKPGLIVMEACGGANFWGRTFGEYGFRVKLISPQFVTPFVKSQKNDRNDAEAIVEAASRKSMRFVSVKTLWQQDLQTLLRAREGAMKQLRALSSQARGLAGEYGVVFSESWSKLKKELPLALESDNDLTPMARETLGDIFKNYLSAERVKNKLDEKLKSIAREDESLKRLQQVPGIGPLTAVAFLSLVGDPKEFKNGRQAAAWLGLVPRQYSTGGRSVLGPITKRGDDYLRYLLIQGGHAVVRSAVKKAEDPRRFYKWARSLKERRGTNIASVAVANRNAKVMWAMLVSGEKYRAA